MSITLRHSNAYDVPRLKNLWQMCFGDDIQYINNYFDNYYKPERVLVLEKNGTIYSMLILFEFSIVSSNKRFKAYYIYAFCTDVAFQNQGYGKMLMSYAEQVAVQHNIFVTMVMPGEKSLVKYYEKLSYSQLFARQAYTYNYNYNFKPNPDCKAKKACETQNLSFEQLSPEQYNIFREQFLKNKSFVSYSDEILQYQSTIAGFSGFFGIRKSNKIIAVYAISNYNNLQIHELLHNCDINTDSLLSIIAERNHSDVIFVQNICEDRYSANTENTAMAKFLSDDFKISVGSWAAFMFE